MARQFIVEEQGRYYVCDAVLEYDPDQAKSDDERAGVRQVAAMFEEACKSGAGLTACPFEGDKHEFAPLNTGPGFPPPPR
jgi:hypothetical protein